MQRKREELHLAMQEYLDVDWTTVKYYLRRQIAKCVQECKSQASNAKRIVGTIKHSHRHREPDAPEPYESDYDSDDWGTDFEDDYDEEVKEEEAPVELNNNTISPTHTGKLESIGQVLANNPAPGKFIPKPPDLPVISKPVNGSAGQRNYPQTNSIPRAPLKRPPSQPPPPPVPQVSSHDEPQEEYEVPINMQSNVVASSVIEKKTFPFSKVPLPTVASQLSVDVETYEIIQPPEEEYELVDAPAMSSNLPEKPVLPPRIAFTNETTSPPPLPQKPRKLHEGFQTHERSDGIRTFSRPKLPVKAEEEGHPEASSSSSIGSTFFTSLLIKRNNLTPTSSPKFQHRSKDGNESILSSNISTVSSIESQSSRSSTPDRDVLGTVGNSSLIATVASPEIKKSSPPPPLPPRGAVSPDDSAQNMATRPLPPVPVPKVEAKSTQSISLCPWFHEVERGDAERQVRNLGQSGSFLVRPSKRAGIQNPYSLTIFHERKLFHLNIRQRSDNTFALGKVKKNEKNFLTVADLIAYHQSEPILLTSRGEPAGTAILVKYPEKL